MRCPPSTPRYPTQEQSFSHPLTQSQSRSLPATYNGATDSRQRHHRDLLLSKSHSPLPNSRRGVCTLEGVLPSANHARVTYRKLSKYNPHLQPGCLFLEFRLLSNLTLHIQPKFLELSYREDLHEHVNEFFFQHHQKHDFEDIISRNPDKLSQPLRIAQRSCQTANSTVT